jgi:tetratricopeptide (TPR) repeat protein
MYYNIRANWQRFEEVQARALSVCEQTGNRVLESVVHAIAGQSLITRGRLQESRQQFQRALDLYDADAHATHRQVFGQDIEVFVRASLGLLLSLMGYCEQARTSARRALARAQELKSPYNICLAKAFLAGTWHYQGRPDETKEVCASLLQDADAFGFADWPPIARILGGWADGIIEGPSQEVDRILAIGNRYVGPYWSFTVAQSELGAGKFHDALARIQAALEQSEELQVAFYDSELLRLRAECLLGLAKTATEERGNLLQAARDAVDQAIQTARQQEARLPLLRCLAVRARLSRESNEAPIRHRDVDEITAWFNETGNRDEVAGLQSILAWS